MNSNVLNILSDYLGMQPSDIVSIAEKAPQTYRMYYIKKKRGGVRQIFHPAKKTKSLQYAINNTLLENFKIHTCAHAYIKNLESPIRKNAEIHAKYKYTVRIDLKDFFPSITPEDLFYYFESQFNKFTLNTDDKLLLKQILFVRQKNNKWGLAIGAPTSPLISNIVMYEIDNQLMSISTSISNNSAYTRYADDIVFSSDEKNTCGDFLEKLETVLIATTNPKLLINRSKTIFSSKATRRKVTGLLITSDGKPSIGRKNKRYIKKLIYDFKKKSISEKSFKYLRGYIAFILDVEPDFYNRLVIKYTESVLAQIKG